VWVTTAPVSLLDVLSVTELESCLQNVDVSHEPDFII
jgi:hypothetical protein